jgi:hypothetical protein
VQHEIPGIGLAIAIHDVAVPVLNEPLGVAGFIIDEATEIPSRGSD